MISEPASVDINVEYTLISLPSDTVSSHVQATSMGYGLGYNGLVILPLSLPVILPPHTDERRNTSIQFIQLFIIKSNISKECQTLTKCTEIQWHV